MWTSGIGYDRCWPVLVPWGRYGGSEDFDFLAIVGCEYLSIGVGWIEEDGV